MNPELEAALAALEALAVRTGPFTRHDVRPVLIGIGTALTASPTADVAAARSRFLASAPSFRESWGAAVRDELAMACTEHIRSVDPRYLDHPAYDLEYTLQAREALADRLRGAELTGIVLDDALSAGIRRADSLLEGRPAADPGKSAKDARSRSDR